MDVRPASFYANPSLPQGRIHHCRLRGSSPSNRPSYKDKMHFPTAQRDGVNIAIKIRQRK
jgi:hypothetical protein